MQNLERFYAAPGFDREYLRRLPWEWCVAFNTGLKYRSACDQHKQLRQLRYDTIEEFNVDSKAEYTA